MTFPPCSRQSDLRYPELAGALALDEARFRQLVNRAAFGIYRSTLDGRFLDVNPALARMLGYESELEMYSLEMARDVYLDPADRDRVRARVRRPDAPDWLDVRWKRRDGTPITVRLFIQPVVGEDGGVESYEGIAEDVTDRLRREELLRRNERMACLGTTVAGVAHELNNPLAAILGFAQLLLRRAQDEEARVALETINHEAARAGRIVRDLLLLARKREAERRTRVNLNDVVSYIVRTRRYTLETHGIACVVDLDTAAPPVLGDRMQLEQVVMNLLNNAEQAIRGMPPRGEQAGRIAIRTRAEGELVVLEVEDDGPGIAAESLERIWDPFWTTRDAGGGTGLGLAVVHGIVAEHGGTVVAENHGRGARFTIQLPRLAPDAVAAERNTTVRQALDVLVVDADPLSLNFLSLFLSSRGHAPLTATDLEQASRLAERMSFDAVICEVRVLAERGALGRLRALPGCAMARFIIAAGEAETTAHLPVPLPPCTAVALRPYDLEELRLLLED